RKCNFLCKLKEKLRTVITSHIDKVLRPQG
uniref:Cathelicidin-PY n=2 Tax=Ranoidea TaxID=30352 RepID=M9MMP3_AQUCT|nr:Chain A, Cathelicidin-PY [Aquarana catesbeiana]